MNISWTTAFPNVNLWLIVNQSWTSPISLVCKCRSPLRLIHECADQYIASYTRTWYEWDVKCGQDCDQPFLLRAVNAAGSDFEQQHGGFYSYQFWIKDTDAASSTVTVPLSTMSTTADLAPTASTTSPSSSTSFTALTSVEASIHSAAATSTTLPASSTAGNDGSATRTTLSPSSTSSNASDSNHDSNTTTTIAVGVGVGVGVALLCCGGFFFWRRRHRKTNDSHDRPPPIDMYRQGWQKPYESDMVELPSRTNSSSKQMPPAEAPGWPMDPYELPAQTPTRLSRGR